MKKLILALIVTLPLITAACNTMEGFGEDVQKGGKKIEKSAEKHN